VDKPWWHGHNAAGTRQTEFAPKPSMNPVMAIGTPYSMARFLVAEIRECSPEAGVEVEDPAEIHTKIPSGRTTTSVLISRAMQFPGGHGVRDSRTTYPWSGQMQLPLYNTHSTLGSPALYPSSCSTLNSGLRDHGYPGPSSDADHTPRHGTPLAHPLIISRTQTPAFRAGNRLTLCSDAEAVFLSLERSCTRGR
jgi:hypothetical protein